jgi:phage shock protein C
MVEAVPIPPCASVACPESIEGLNPNGDTWNSRTDDMSTRPPLRRSRRNRMIAGVVGGLADYFGLDPSLARIIYVLVSIFSAAFPGIIVYIVLWILIPQED